MWWVLVCWGFGFVFSCNLILAQLCVTAKTVFIFHALGQ